MSDPSSDLSTRGPRRWPWVLVLLLLVAAGYWFWSVNQGKSTGGFRRFGGPMAGASVPVKVAVVEQGKIDYTLKAIGTVTAFNTVTVRSRVDGELLKLEFQDGQKVEKGDVLARIDPRNYRIQLDQALGQQKQNEAQLKNAQKDLQRYQLLYKQNSIARQQVDAQEALVQQLIGARTSDQAAVDNARLQLEYTDIVAPISGRLGLRRVDEGNIVNASSTDGLVVITQTQPVSVLFTLPQAQLADVLAQLRTGNTLAVELYDRDDIRKLADGELMSLDNQIDVATGTVKMKARFANEDESLFPNQFVNVRLRVETRQALVLPTQAIQQGSIGPFVYLIDEQNKSRIQAISTGRVDGRRVEILSGLSAGQRVVTEGTDRLRDGAAVEITEPGTDKPVAAAAARPTGGGAPSSRRNRP
ncbi:MdtA/MuxA family multidrug efflux RND transporter periplasmic adaptor subunit [Alcaligenaceae bacterium]|nr:MdtA/MuxA family multidrug efflux RND transporter periplasmic adaptor subunit [Alcaligenaceae bacterium]